jgi:hypothetical protein
VSGGGGALQCAEGKGGGREGAELVITGGINAAPHLLQNLLVLRAESPHWLQYIDNLVNFKRMPKNSSKTREGESYFCTAKYFKSGAPSAGGRAKIAL